MAILAKVEYTQLLQWYNTMTALHTELVGLRNELDRLAEIEMIPVRVRVDGRTLQVLREQAETILVAMRAVDGTAGKDPV